MISGPFWSLIYFRNLWIVKRLEEPYSPSLRKNETKQMEVKNVKTSTTKMVFGAAVLFLLMAFLTPAVSASFMPVSNTGEDSAPLLSVSESTDASFSDTSAPAYTAPSGIEEESAPAVDPAQDRDTSDVVAETGEQSSTEPAQIDEEVPVDPEIDYPEDETGKGKGKGQGQGYLLNNFKKNK